MKAAGFLHNLNDSARENPLAAGLIGLGLAWMLVGRSTALARAGSGAAGAASDAVAGTADVMSGAADQAREAASRVSEAVSEGVGAAASGIRGAVDTGAKTSGKEPDGRAPFARTFADVLERQPLALAAAGVAVGAAIAYALPSTEAEDRLMGRAAEDLRDTARDAADVVAGKVASAIEGGVDEAQAQNLTPSAVRDAAKAGAAKLKAAGDAARKAVEK